MELLDEDEAKQKVRSYFRSHDWWIVPWFSERASDFSLAFEKRFYSGKASGDFHMMTTFVAGRMVVIGFGKKSRAPLRRMAKFMVEEMDDERSREDLERSLKTQDVIVAINPDDDRQVLLAWMALMDDWMFSGGATKN